MLGKTSNYSLISRVDDQQARNYSGAPLYESDLSERGRVRGERNLDRERVSEQRRWITRGMLPSSIGIQRQISGFRFGESSLSGECYAPTISAVASDSDGFSYVREIGRGHGDTRIRVSEGTGVADRGFSSKSWAQEAESYQLQMALVLRLSLEETCAYDPNSLDLDESASRRSSYSPSAESISHRFWINGCLSYFDKVPDGFYLIHGMDPFVWTVCNDLQKNGGIPSVASLKSVDPREGSPLEVVLFDGQNDSRLRGLLNVVQSIYRCSITIEEIVEHLAKLVCNAMGGVALTREEEIVPNWKKHIDNLKDCMRSIVIPVGRLPVGLCRHRALLFKVLADTIALPCRIARGCKYCSRDDGASCLVRFGADREQLVDLIGNPGCLCGPDSMLNGPSSISISSPLRLPSCKRVQPPLDLRGLAKQYFSDGQSLNIAFQEARTGGFVSGGSSKLQLPSNAPETTTHYRNSQLLESSENCTRSPNTALNIVLPTRSIGISSNSIQLFERNNLVQSTPVREINLHLGDLVIPWKEIGLKESIGAGSFGTVYRAEWNGSEVAVKILLEQDIHAECFKEFLMEVAIMTRLRHPNIVLFMGAVTEPPNLSIVTEYQSRGSLFNLLHRPNARRRLNERRRLNMAYDVAQGMNHLHKHNPPIVHRDLKSPNLLVDAKYTVKVSDFGLSRLKAKTFLSSQSAAGTPEWMAPEVLRAEPSNEKSDVYSFGVILWELVTLQRPWSNLSPEQVVAAVALMKRRLEIPPDVNPQVATIIEACWAAEPWNRPSFASIMESLSQLV